MSTIQARMAGQRAARLARDATLALAAQAERHAHRTSAPDFWDNIDTSGGPDACHPWTGDVRRNHPDNEAYAGRAAFFTGAFRYEGCESTIGPRVLCFATYGREPPRDMDMTPLCGDHLCMNIKHYCIGPHGYNQIGDKLHRSVPVEEFFCDGGTNGRPEQATAAGHSTQH